MNTLQRIQDIQKHFEETPKEQILCNMRKAGFDVEDDLSLNTQLKVAAKKKPYKSSVIYKISAEKQLWSTKEVGIGS